MLEWDVITPEVSTCLLSDERTLPVECDETVRQLDVILSPWLLRHQFIRHVQCVLTLIVVVTTGSSARSQGPSTRAPG